MIALRQILLLLGKDLRIEARTRQALALVLVLGILIVVVLALGLQGGNTRGGLSATAILWVAYLFGGAMCFEKTMAVETHDGALAGLLMAPMDRGVIYLSKLLANLVLMATLAIVITPVGVVLFGFDLSRAPLAFASVVGASLIGYAAIGTLFSGLVASSRLSGGLLAVVVFPLSLPLVIASTQLLKGVFEHGNALDASAMGVIVAFDVIFLTVSWIVFELVIEP